MFNIWQSVQVSNAQHARTGQAGTVQGTNPKTPDQVAVKFDADGVTEIVSVTDLRAL